VHFAAVIQLDLLQFLLRLTLGQFKDAEKVGAVGAKARSTSITGLLSRIYCVATYQALTYNFNFVVLVVLTVYLDLASRSASFHLPRALVFSNVEWRVGLFLAERLGNIVVAIF